MKRSDFNIIKILKYLSNKRKKELTFTFIIMVISGLSELLVINSVIPFLAIITNPESLLDYQISRIILNLFSISLDGENKIIFIFIFIFIFCIILSATSKLLSLWMSFKLTASVGNDLSTRCFSNNLNQPYEFHLRNNSSKLIATSTLFINNTISSFSAFLNLIYSLFLTIIISFAVLLINPSLTFYSLIIFSSVYFFIGKKFRNLIIKNSKIRALADESLIKSLQEGLGSIRNVLLESNQELYVSNFKKYDLNSRKYQSKNYLISEFPRYAIEALALIFIATACLILIVDNSKPSSILISIGAFALGIQKLLPALQRIYQNWSSIKSFTSDIENTLKTLESKNTNTKSRIFSQTKFKNSIKFDSVFFSYKENKNIISDLSFEIFKGQRIGIIGVTGSGKTTLTDLIMGLLNPTMGKIFVDGKDIHDKNYPIRINKWMNTISHVPQNVYLTDSTIAENIAFGVKKNLISIKKIKEAAKKAKIHDFIESTKDGYLTKVGERGIRLSGGQIQRIAIARALYKKSDILVFDEATSALDHNTELELINSIKNLSNELTVISVAHRHTTLRDYDRIFKVEKGSIIEEDKENLTY